MPQIEFKAPADFKKLEGWTVKRSWLDQNVVHMIMFHPAAERPVHLSISSEVGLGLSGNVVLANAITQTRISDVYEALPEERG